MEFVDFLRGAGITPETTAIALHKPGSERIRRQVAVFADTDPELFYAYQATHPRIQEATLKARKTMAAFVARTEGEFVFAGLFAQTAWAEMAGAELDADPLFQKLQGLTGGWTYASAPQISGNSKWAKFQLEPMKQLTDLIGRLVVSDPMARNYMRLAETTPLRVIEVARVANLVPPMPAWDRLTLTRDEVMQLPNDWALRLSEWRGIYLIVDQTDGARYVGAAYGEENLLGRWRAHCQGELGVTRRLSERKTGGFRFSILELLSPAATVNEVTAREQSWMARLDTVRFGLNS